MSLEEKINADIKSAMLAKEKEKLNALRAIKSALLLLKTEKGGGEITEELELKTLQKLAKQRKESAETYRAQNRIDLAIEEEEQLAVIAQYLPQQLSVEEITASLQELIVENGIGGVRDMGKLMGLATKKFAGKADNKVVSEIVKSLLS